MKFLFVLNFGVFCIFVIIWNDLSVLNIHENETSLAPGLGVVGTVARCITVHGQTQ